MFAWLKSLWLNPARDWVLLFLAIQCLVEIDGATNANSRWTTLVAMVEDQTFHTDRYYGHSMDWAKTPQHYYSNKAPGPMLIGYPLFWYLDHEKTRYVTERGQRDDNRVAVRGKVLRTLSLTFQAFPYAALVLMFIRTLQQRGLPKAALHFTAAALLFGNTASLFMNTYFGHGLAAVLVLGGLYTLLKKRYVQAGLWLGLATLSDYGASLLLLPALGLLFLDGGPKLRRLVGFSLGGVIPGALWFWYHVSCFGSPFALPNKFQNPTFVDAQKHVPQLWGILRLIPDTKVLKELLVGPARGLLYTQGWVLVAFSAVAVFAVLGLLDARFRLRDRFLVQSAIFSCVGLVLVMAMNCSFNGWHGGMTPGPRYLSHVFPAFAITAGLLFPRLPAIAKQAMMGFLVLAGALFILVYSTKNVLAPETSLFDSYFNDLLGAKGTHLERALYLLLAFGVVSYRAVVDSVGVSRPIEDVTAGLATNVQSATQEATSGVVSGTRNTVPAAETATSASLTKLGRFGFGRNA